ncbi:MAG: PadR family transcriptional regulator, partial [Bacteroidota bacterium]
LYPLLHKLEADGVVSTEYVNIGKRVRRYYQLTPDGLAKAKELIDEFIDFMTTMNHILDPNPRSGYVPVER